DCPGRGGKGAGPAGGCRSQCRERNGGLRRGIVQLGPIPVKTVGAFGLLQLLDVVVFLTPLETELDRVLAFHPGDIVVNLKRSQVLVVVVIAVPAAIIQHVAKGIVLSRRVAVGVDRGPSGYAERVWQT